MPAGVGGTITSGIAAPPPGFADEPSGISSVKIAVNSNVHHENESGSSIKKKVESTRTDDLSIILPAPSDQELYPDETQAEMETFEVELIKDQQGLGITIAGYVCEKG